MVRPSILLHPNIPKPLHGIAPRSILGWRWWNKTRYQAYKKEGFCCHACGIPVYKAEYRNLLEAHECYKIDYKKARMYYLETVALCHSCHSFIHSGRLEMLLLANEISVDKYTNIMKCGSAVKSKVVCSNPYTVHSPSNPTNWEDWRLVLLGKEYPGMFRDIVHWYAYYNKGG